MTYDDGGCDLGFADCFDVCFDTGGGDGDDDDDDDDEDEDDDDDDGGQEGFSWAI